MSSFERFDLPSCESPLCQARFPKLGADASSGLTFSLFGIGIDDLRKSDGCFISIQIRSIENLVRQLYRARVPEELPRI